MKKIKVILIILASLVLLFFLLIKIFAVKGTKDISTQSTGDWLNEKIEPTYLPEKPDLSTYASTPKQQLITLYLLHLHKKILQIPTLLI